MPYIGRDNSNLSNVEVLDNITFDGSSSYTLQKGGVNFTPSSANNILISIDGVVQAGNFTVSSSTIDFGTAVAGTSTCDFILHYGTGLITTPADGTVTTAKLADSSVSLAKLTATGTKDSTTFLRGDNTFAVPTDNGKILQVVNTTSTAQRTTTSTSFTDASISVSITPSSTSSKILILSNTNIYSDTTGEATIVTVYRDATNLGHSVEGMGRFQNGASNLFTNWSVSVFDSPATTSATTYEIYFRATGGGAIAYVSYGTSPTFITALEIGA